MQTGSDFKFEKYETYYGDVAQVKKIINQCNICGTKLVHSHLSDYSNLFVQESVRCPDCGNNQGKTIHIIN